jgi:hypothetical protein
VPKYSRYGDGIHGGFMGIEALNYWKEFFNAKELVVSCFLII